MIFLTLYLSTFFQSKLRLMTTGGGPGFASSCGVVPDRQGDVNAQHRPSAESEKSKKRKYKAALWLKNKQNTFYVAQFALATFILHCSSVHKEAKVVKHKCCQD